MNKILIIGSSGHSKVVIDIVEKQGLYEIIGIIDSFKLVGQYVYNYEILGTEEDIPQILETHNVFGGIIAVGDNFTRMTLYQKICAIKPDFHFVNSIHPKAIMGKNVVIGDGTVIMAGTVINSDVIIGKQVILNTKCSVDHDVKVNDFSSIAPGATLGENVEIGICSAVSLGANIIENKKIGNNTIVGAGALVNKSFGDNEIVYGIPAKTIRKRKDSERYLGLRYKGKK